jgi:hypothetical protein
VESKEEEIDESWPPSSSIAGRVLGAVVARPVSVGVAEVERRAEKDDLAAPGASHLPAGNERSEPLPERPVRAAIAGCLRAATTTGALDPLSLAARA